MLLAAHPHEQRALQAEIDAVLQQGKRGLAYEDLDKLVLCQGSMNEALRLFPPVVIIPKFCVPNGGAELVSAEVSQCMRGCLRKRATTPAVTRACLNRPVSR